MVAVCQARADARGRAYYRKKMAEDKSRKEALGCLKRRISDAVFKSLTTDCKNLRAASLDKEEPRRYPTASLSSSVGNHLGEARKGAGW
jgi:transposase